MRHGSNMEILKFAKDKCFAFEDTIFVLSKPHNRRKSVAYCLYKQSTLKRPFENAHSLP